jgi:hypothetical protein
MFIVEDLFGHIREKRRHDSNYRALLFKIQGTEHDLFRTRVAFSFDEVCFIVES